MQLKQNTFGLYFLPILQQRKKDKKNENKDKRFIKKYVFKIYKQIKGTSSEGGQEA